MNEVELEQTETMRQFFCYGTELELNFTILWKKIGFNLQFSILPPLQRFIYLTNGEFTGSLLSQQSIYIS